MFVWEWSVSAIKMWYAVYEFLVFFWPKMLQCFNYTLDQAFIRTRYGWWPISTFFFKKKDPKAKFLPVQHSYVMLNMAYLLHNLQTEQASHMNNIRLSREGNFFHVNTFENPFFFSLLKNKTGNAVKSQQTQYKVFEL